MRLNEFQQRFEAYLLDESGAVAPELLAAIRGGPELGALEGLQIYHHAYRARLVDALRGDYPTVHHWLGDEEFESLAHAYLRVHPSAHFSLRWLGAGLADFIEAWLVPEQAEPLAELARLEWAFTLAFDAADGEPLTLEHMARLSAEDWPALRLALLPSVQRVPCRHNSLALWRAVKEAREFPGSRLLERPELCLVWRRGLVGQYRSLSGEEGGALLGMAVEGWNFARLCEELGEPLQAAQWLKLWISEGVVARV
ncbi:HvfC/BufC N-terminal domain-containing protein [Pseudomonas sp. Q1-7]|uniref:HvfC/BufC N-terminal domain-containing protein n=1 Tax=Pseudomonas sp. Q1-7 TaxID=3020843 RepID=UPI002301698F|nr:DNA-binding domain-containing protein [Pseudomonas sp. Q1-7]